MKKLLLLALLISSTSLYAADFDGGSWGVGGSLGNAAGAVGHVGYYTKSWDVSGGLGSNSNTTKFILNGHIKTKLVSNTYVTGGLLFVSNGYSSGEGVSIGLQSLLGSQIILHGDYFPLYFVNNGSTNVGTVASVGMTYLF